MKRTLFLIVYIFLAFCSQAAPTRYLEGYVVDVQTKAPLNGVSVSVKNTSIGATTNEKGYYRLIIPSGSHWVEFSFIGYRRSSKFITDKENSTLNIELTQESVMIDELVVTEDAPDKNVSQLQMSSHKLDLKAIKKMPALFGEADLIKSLFFQPGVTTVGEGAGGFNVRGGRVDQNLILLDGAPLFNTSHLLGFYTNVNTDFIKEGTLIKGGIPASYGGRLSSILSMNSKNGDNERIKGSGTLSFMSGKLMLEGPIKKDKLTFVTGGRIAFPNWMISNFPGKTARNRAFFYDVNLRTAWKINEKNLLTLTGYYSYDNFRFTRDTVNSWNSSLLSLNYSNVLSKNIQFLLNVNQSDYSFGLEGKKEGFQFDLASSIRHREVKGSFILFIPRHKIEWGINTILYRVNPGDNHPKGNEGIKHVKIATESGSESSVFASEEFTLTDRISFQAGVRYSYFRNTGPHNSYVYADNTPKSEQSITDTLEVKKGETLTEYGGFEPRLSLKFEVTDNASVKFSYNRMRQYLHFISNTTAISPVDYWKLSDKHISPQVSDQWAVGIFHNFFQNNLEVSVEGFYKELDDLVEYKNGAKLLLNPIIETALLPAKGLAYGVEVYVGKTKGHLTGHIGYTYSRSYIAVRTPFDSERINKGRYYPSNFDIPHSVVFSGQLLLKRGWTISSGFIYNTGRPATYPDGKYAIKHAPVINYSRRNADRIPDYHRLDLSFSKDTRINSEQKRYSLWVISFYNVYARKNPYSIYFTHNNTVTNSYRLSVLGTIIPSISYTYNF